MEFNDQTIVYIQGFAFLISPIAARSIILITGLGSIEVTKTPKSKRELVFLKMIEGLLVLIVTTIATSIFILTIQESIGKSDELTLKFISLFAFTINVLYSMIISGLKNYISGFVVKTRDDENFKRGLPEKAL